MGYLAYGHDSNSLELSDYRISLARQHLPEVLGPHSILMLGIRFMGFEKPVQFHTQFHRSGGGMDVITAVRTDINWSKLESQVGRTMRPHKRVEPSVTSRFDIRAEGVRLQEERRLQEEERRLQEEERRLQEEENRRTRAPCPSVEMPAVKSTKRSETTKTRKNVKKVAEAVIQVSERS